MDAIEAGVVKVPRLPVSDNQVNVALPAYRNLFQDIKGELPKKGRAKQKDKEGGLDAENLPKHLQGALQALDGHYQQTFAEWDEIRRRAPHAFIDVGAN